MKKLFSILAIAALVSCNSGSNEEAVPATDTTAVTPAPAPEATPVVIDTTAKVDTAAAAK